MRADDPVVRCAKAGCEQVATELVILYAADGSDSWRSCLQHAREFRDWVAVESEADGGFWASVQIEWTGTSAF
jgi:hypothetical protein